MAADPEYWAGDGPDYIVGKTADTALGALLTFALCAMCLHRKVRTQVLPIALTLWWFMAAFALVDATFKANACAGPSLNDGLLRLPLLVAISFQ